MRRRWSASTLSLGEQLRCVCGGFDPSKAGGEVSIVTEGEKRIDRHRIPKTFHFALVEGDGVVQ